MANCYFSADGKLPVAFISINTALAFFSLLLADSKRFANLNSNTYDD